MPPCGPLTAPHGSPTQEPLRPPRLRCREEATAPREPLHPSAAKPSGVPVVAGVLAQDLGCILSSRLSHEKDLSDKTSSLGPPSAA